MKNNKVIKKTTSKKIESIGKMKRELNTPVEEVNLLTNLVVFKSHT